MAEVLVLVEHAEGALKKVTSELITAARVLGEPSAVVVGAPGTAEPLADGSEGCRCGQDLRRRVRRCGELPGHPEGRRAGVAGRVGRPGRRAGGREPEGKEVAGRLAARTGSGVLTDVVDVKEGGKAAHSIFGGAFTVDAEAVATSR